MEKQHGSVEKIFTNDSRFTGSSRDDATLVGRGCLRNGTNEIVVVLPGRGVGVCGLFRGARASGAKIRVAQVRQSTEIGTWHGSQV